MPSDDVLPIVVNPSIPVPPPAFAWIESIHTFWFAVTIQPKSTMIL